MERPAHSTIQRPRRFSPRKIVAISGAVVLEVAVIYAVANDLTFSGIRAIPHTIQVAVLQTPPPKVQPVVVPPTELVKPTTASVPPPEIQIETPPQQPQITATKMPPHPVMPAPVQTAAAPAPPAPPKPQGITAPVSIGGSHSCMNEYPATAQRLNQQGTTSIKFTVSTDGSVSDVQVVNSSGHDTLDAAAIRCASSWHYKPALENSQPVSAPWTTNVQWKLQNGSSPT